MLGKEIIEIIENIAPLSLQESYDNSGLITGNPNQEIESVLLSLDCTVEVVREAIEKGCGMIISHHPVLFRPLKNLIPDSDSKNAIIEALKNDILIYAAHTNLDNVLRQGVNTKIASKLGLKNCRILEPKKDLLDKLVIYAPVSHAEKVREAMFAEGSGSIGDYSECSFNIAGKGTFKPGDESNPYSGTRNKRDEVDEIRIEALAYRNRSGSIIESVRKVHPYEEMAYEIYPVSNPDQTSGSGMIGELEKPMKAAEFLSHLKKSMNTGPIKHTATERMVSKVAVCGGSGSFLTSKAIRSGADAYITADIKYHEFFDAGKDLLLCDIGHYESEIYTLELFFEIIREKYPNFAVIFCKTITNPVKYYS